jgi:ribonucleoside-triphosphate reductase
MKCGKSNKGSDKRIHCLVYSRVVGYIRPLDLWHAAKQLEFEERQVYDVKEYRNNRRPEEADMQPSPA